MNPLLLFFVVALVVVSSSIVNASSSISLTYSGGTVEHGLRAFDALNLTEVTQATSSNSFFHVHLFDQMTHAEFHTIPLMAAPVCVGANVSGGYPLEFTTETLANWMSTVGYTASVESLRSSAPVSTSDLTLVLAADSPTTRVVTRALADREVGVFAGINPWTLPDEVLSNTDIMFVADDDAVVQTLKTTPNTVGLTVVARGTSLACAAIRITDPYTKESSPTYPRLGDESIVNLKVDIETNNVTAVNSLYPFVGPVQ